MDQLGGEEPLEVEVRLSVRQWANGKAPSDPPQPLQPFELLIRIVAGVLSLGLLGNQQL